MSDVALLNPAQEAEVCAKMLTSVKGRLEVIDRDLTTTVLDRDQYLMKIGAAKELRVLEMSLQRIYDQNFNV